LGNKNFTANIMLQSGPPSGLSSKTPVFIWVKEKRDIDQNMLKIAASVFQSDTQSEPLVHPHCKNLKS
jgi:hypothetical protein